MVSISWTWSSYKCSFGLESERERDYSFFLSFGERGGSDEFPFVQDVLSDGCRDFHDFDDPFPLAFKEARQRRCVLSESDP